jgi:hypothetical protein
MIQALIDWWRGYSEEDMENVKDRISFSKSSGIYVNGPERLALRHLCNMRKENNSRSPESRK